MQKSNWVFHVTNRLYPAISLGAELSAQVKSRRRVREHGEVFTNEREVNAMLDMVKQETERIESRFLEPACGDGNILAEVLRRKLAVVKSFYRKSPTEYMRYAFVAVASIMEWISSRIMRTIAASVCSGLSNGSRRLPLKAPLTRCFLNL